MENSPPRGFILNPIVVQKTSVKMDQVAQKRRSRRSSITLHLQRIFHADKEGNPGQQWTGEWTEKKPFHDYLNETQSYNSSRELGTSLSSKHTTTNKTESTPLSIQPTPQESPADSPRVEGLPTPDESSNMSDICVSTSWNNNAAPKKENRATRRLEEERKELEKRFWKLEQAELAGDLKAMKRESRRLTKKQPAGSSNRDSSVSADESRSSSRSFTSFFSGSRRSSRSRSSSANGTDRDISRRQSVAPEGTQTDDSTALQSATPLSTTLPERLSTVISKELVAKNNSLLQNHTPSMQSQNSLQTTASITNSGETPIKEALSNGNETSPSNRPGPITNGATKEDSAQKGLSSPQASSETSDLDRLSFAATLNLGKRAKSTNTHSRSFSSSRLSLPSKRLTTQVENYSKPLTTRHSKAYITSDINQGVLNSRNSLVNIPQRHHKSLKSSPLAKSLAPSNNIDSSSENGRAAAVQPVQNTDGTRLITTSALVSTKTNGLSAKPTSSRIYASPNSVLGLRNVQSRRIGPNEDAAAQALPAGSGSNIPQGSARLGSQSIPHVPERSARRGASNHSAGVLSSRNSSPEPSSDDYDTADEAASIVSLPQNDDDHPADHLSNNMPATRSIDVSGHQVPSNSAGRSSASVISSRADLPSSKKPGENTRDYRQDQLVEKVFVICCHCKIWLDMPSATYAKNAPLNSIRGASNTKSPHQRTTPGLTASPRFPDSPVRCSFCKHLMSKECCQGWTTVVHMRERHH